MDPNEALNILLDRARVVREYCDGSDVLEGIEVEANELAEAAEALDAWIRGGGFLPAAWEPKPKRTPVHAPRRTPFTIDSVREKHHPGAVLGSDYEDGFVPFIDDDGNMPEPEEP